MLQLLAILAFLAAAPALAQEPEWPVAREFDILMRPFDYEPRTIRLEAGRPVKLRFINQGQAGFSFSARQFFQSARVRSGDAEEVADGGVELAPGEIRIIALVPAPGRYRAHSGNLVHRILGMNARIVVE